MSGNGTGSSLEILPVAGRIGAEIKGVRLSGELEPTTVESIGQTLFKYNGVARAARDWLVTYLPERKPSSLARRSRLSRGSRKRWAKLTLE